MARETVATAPPERTISWARYFLNIGCGAVFLGVLSIYALFAGAYVLIGQGSVLVLVVVVLLIGGSVHAVVWASRRRPPVGLGLARRTDRDSVLASMSLLDSRPHVTLKSHPP